MTNEATLVYETEIPISYTCSDGTGIEKGAFLVLSDPMTVAKATVHESAVGGIASQEKIADNGKTRIGVYRSGIFKALGSGNIAVGEALVFSGGGVDNVLETAATNDQNIVGYALETATNGQTFLFELRPTRMELV